MTPRGVLPYHPVHRVGLVAGKRCRVRYLRIRFEQKDAWFFMVHATVDAASVAFDKR